MALQPQQYNQELGVSARRDRQMLAAMFEAGVVEKPDLLVTAGGGMNTAIAKGTIFVEGTENADQGTYRLFNDAPVNILHTADPTNPRINRIIVRVYDSTEHLSGADTQTFELLAGAPTSGATLDNRNGAVPDIDIPDNSLVIAEVLVPAGASSLSGVNIRDYRPCALRKADPGDYKHSASATPPIGYSVADGRLAKRARFARLFAEIGVVYNVGGEAADEFRFPTIEGRALVGQGTHADVNALTDNEGVALGNRRPRHAHTVTVAAAGSHTHGTQIFVSDNDAAHDGNTVSTADPGSRFLSSGCVNEPAAGSHVHTAEVGPQVAAPTDGPAYQVATPLIFTGMAFAS